jgi:serine/threonine-protein kinase
MADVFRARDHTRQREVAVKILRQSLTQSSEAVQRFQREARVQEMVQHPNVAALYDGGVTREGEPFLVVELLRGRSLRTALRSQGRVSMEMAASYCFQALQGLAAVHTLGVRHRDLKPGNMMLEPSGGAVERVVLIDFGFAALEGASKLTLQGYVVGSLSYMAPERLTGEPGDERADLYSMGIVLYEMLVGRPPFRAVDDYDLIRAHLEDQPVPPSTAEPACAINPAMESVLMRALSKDPRRRPESAQQMARDLEQAQVIRRL